MKFEIENPFGLLPNFMMQMRTPMTGQPFSFNCTGDVAVGNASGYAKDALLSSFGEYVERAHFYNEVSAVKKLKVTDSIMVEAINQVKQIDAPIESHKFEMCEAIELNSEKNCCIPKALISLASTGDDANYIPFIDSCGQAAHVTHEFALQASIKEFVERQALIGAWLSGEAIYRITPLINLQNQLFDLFTSNGSLYIYQLGKGLPGYSIIIFYFSSSIDDVVQYAVGMANDYYPSVAMLKALNELWQTYQFIYLNARKPENLDIRFTYLNTLLQFNTQTTKNVIPFFEAKKELAYEGFINQQPYTLKMYKSQLATLSSRIYLYHASTYLFGKRYYVCKTISPDFYFHMGIKMPLNLKNNYAQELKINDERLIKSSIPFP